MLGFALLIAACTVQIKEPIIVNVDATDAPRNFVKVSEDIPARPGPCLIRFPKWIPGEHAPSGPLRNAIQMHLFANGKELPWRRDDVELYDIHVTIPPGASRLHLNFIDGEATGDTMTSNFARMKWNRVMFLPKGPVEQMPVHASVMVPSGWTVYDALPFSRSGDVVTMSDTNVERLIDSPILMGKYTVDYQIEPGHDWIAAGDEPKDIVASKDMLDGVKRLVDEEHAVWGAQHYRTYKWLTTFSNFGGYEGLEHNECSEDGMGADTLTSGGVNADFADLLAHEYTHSWCGKYRRPADLYQQDYATPMGGSLLWVYEGMTQYWGDLLPARAGLYSADHFKDTLTYYAARYGIKDGRTWKSTEDTAIAGSIDRHPSSPWANAFRGQDYYEEGVLVWIGADAKIRELTKGQKSLNDFCHLFAGPPDTGPMIKPYTYEDIVRLLNQVVPWDWDGYLRRMVIDVHPAPTTEGIEMAGWRLVFNDTPGSSASHLYDLGLDIGTDGTINDMIFGSPGDRAGIAPGMKILLVDGKPYSDSRLNDAVKAGNPDLLVTKDDVVSTVNILYTGGLKFAHLERIPNTTDYLTQICQPMAKK